MDILDFVVKNKLEEQGWSYSLNAWAKGNHKVVVEVRENLSVKVITSSSQIPIFAIGPYDNYETAFAKAELEFVIHSTLDVSELKERYKFKSNRMKWVKLILSPLSMFRAHQNLWSLVESIQMRYAIEKAKSGCTLEITEHTIMNHQQAAVWLINNPGKDVTGNSGRTYRYVETSKSAKIVEVCPDGISKLNNMLPVSEKYQIQK